VTTVAYARLSKDRSGLSENVDIQKAEAEEHATHEGLTIVAVHSDNDISASKYSTKPRPGYEALLDDVRAGKVEIIIVTEMTRLYRRMEELLVLIKLAETTKLRKIMVTDGSGYNLSTGEGVFNAVSAVNTAMLESRKISDRIKRKKKATAAAGKFHGGGRPFGYEADGMTIRETEATLIREIVQRLIGGEGMSDIVRELNERGTPTALGKQWRLANIWRAVHNKRLIGIRDAQWQRVPGAMAGHLHGRRVRTGTGLPRKSA
jgi:site-specific DNA recombinase